MAATENPFESLRNAITSSAKVYAANQNDAWVYGIIIGWDDKDFTQLQEMYRWSDKTCTRLKRLHEKYIKATEYAVKGLIRQFAQGFGKEPISTQPQPPPPICEYDQQEAAP